MRAYMSALKKHSDTSKTITQPVTNEFVPLEIQIQQLMASLPETIRTRDWNMDDLIARLSGKYRARPHAMKVAGALRKLGLTRYRDYTREGEGRRMWRHP